MPEARPLRVAIVGAGIGGCAAALALRRAGLEVEVFDQVPNKTEVGAGIQVSPNASRLLRRYGLGECLEAVAVRPLGVEMRRWDDGRVLSREAYGDALEGDFGAPHYHVHRADLLELLAGAIPPDRLHHGKRCVGFEDQDHGVRVAFADGSSVEADILIGADGIHSLVREALLGPESPRFSGNVAFRGLVPAERIAHLGIRRSSTNWVGPGGHFVHYYVSGGRFLNVVAVTEQASWTRESWTDTASVEEAHAAFAGWHPDLHAILDGVERVFKWALFDREPLPVWTRGRVALLGDSCHPMLPYMAQGAAQAIEDGAVLALCLAAAGSDGGAAALARYEAERKPRATFVQSLARGNATTFHLGDGPAQAERDARLAQRSDGSRAGEVSTVRAQIYAYDAERDL